MQSFDRAQISRPDVTRLTTCFDNARCAKQEYVLIPDLFDQRTRVCVNRSASSKLRINVCVDKTLHKTSSPFCWNCVNRWHSDGARV